MENNTRDSDVINRRKLKKSMKLRTFHFALIYFFNFTAYSSLEVFQSSLNFEDGLGTLSLSLLYGTYAMSSLLIGPLIVLLLKPKWSLFISLLPHTFFIIANVFPSWPLMLTASAIVGIVSPLIWITQGTYLNNVALDYAKLSEQKLEHILAKFVGTFFLISGLCNPIGTLISSLVLSRTIVNNSTCPYETNYTLYLNHDNDVRNKSCSRNTELCGPNHCPYMDDHLEVLQKPDDWLIYILMTVFLLFNVTAIILCLSLQHIPSPSDKVTLTKKLTNICKIFKTSNMWLLLPLQYFCGLMPATIFSSFTQSFVSCTFGVGMVGYVMMAEGCAYCFMSVVSGNITKYIRRSVQMTVGGLIIIGFFSTCLLWQPDSDDLWIVVVMVIICGFAHGALEIQINALTSLLFSEDPEAAFGQLNVWQSVGYIIGFGYNSLLCFNIKAYSLILTTVVALLCLMIIEIKLHRNGTKEEHKTTEEIPIKSIDH